jgi:hypothetical protein
MDRLYGDLKKLHELAEPISDEVLDARIEQARAVDQSRGWKHLLKARAGFVRAPCREQVRLSAWAGWWWT